MADQVFGIRRDGSYYTRIQWASHTVQNPMFWVCNLIDDDIERMGGTWGANTMGPANCVLDFFGETQEISLIKLFHNVGANESKIEELASEINFYVSDDDTCCRLGDENADINQVKWTHILKCEMEKKEYWADFKLDTPVKAKYVRIELVKNHGTPPELPWTETNELKMFPPQ